MATELTGCGKVIVWLVVPAAFGILGYFAVGPNIGGIGARVPAVRSIGREIASKVRKDNSGPAVSPTSKPSAENAPGDATGNAAPKPPAESGATEFQRIREEDAQNKLEKARSRRSPIDRVD